MSSAPDSTKAQMFFKYGNDAALKKNFDYAIDMYRRACKDDPENLMYRQALRATEKNKFNNDPAKVGRLVMAKTQAIRLKVRSLKQKAKFTEILEQCEDGFVSNPWDVGISRDFAEAAEQLGYRILAQWAVEAVQTQAQDAEFFRFSAHIHELNQSWQKAIMCWERVKKLEPNDENATRQINALSASATITRAGLDDAIDKRQNADPLAAELEDMKAQKVTPEERYLKEIQEDPKKVYPYLQLAEIFKLRGQLEEAQKLLDRGLKNVPGNSDIQEAYAEIQIARLQGAIAKCNARLKERPDDEKAKAKHEEFSTVLNDYEIKEFRRRLANQPEELGLQYQLGLRLAKAGKHDDAIAAFQQARNSPQHQVEALYQAGLSFESKGMPKLAERFYLDALKLADPKDTKTTNALHYRLGRVSEAQGNNAAAEEHYNEVAANDYTYLDVAKRLRDLGT